MITRRVFGQLSAGAVAVAGFSPFSFVRGMVAQDSTSETEDFRRVGVNHHGAHWGSHEEKIDLRSGNLSFAIPLLHLKSRHVKAAVHCSYNSQIWMQKGHVAQSFGRDLGAGFGWHIGIAAIIPVTQNGLTTGYTYVDRTGAEYQLVERSGKWLLCEHHFATWHPERAQLVFKNGTTHTFGCISSPGEQDAGTFYPTLIECSNGNQIIVRYLPGLGRRSGNSSGRISEIQDARSGYNGNGNASYLFFYNSERTPQLLSIVDLIGGGHSYSFEYEATSAVSPFHKEGEGAQIVQALRAIKYGVDLHTTGTRTFKYNLYGELITAQQPKGGIRSWDYRSTQLREGDGIREISSRYFLDPYSSANAHTYMFDRDSSDVISNVHSSAVVTGPSSDSKSRWTFISDPMSPDFGRLLRLERMSNGTVVHKKELQWSKTRSGIHYVSERSETLDPGTSNEKVARHQTVLDDFANITTHASYDYGNSSVPSRVIAHTYLNSPEYIERHILNLRTSTTVSGGGESAQVTSHVYDTTPITSRTGLGQHNSQSYGTARQVRGNPTEIYHKGLYKRVEYDITGMPVDIRDGSGTQISLLPADGTNNTEVGMLIPNGNPNFASQVQYKNGKRSLLTTPNGAQVSYTHDELGRLKSITGVDGVVVEHEYQINPTAHTKTVNGRWSKTTHGGFGHKIKHEVGDSSGTHSTVIQEYGPVAHAHQGKLTRITLPFGPTAEPQWMTRSFDGIGRKTSESVASTGGINYISYAGNAVEITDPVGRKRQLVHDVHHKTVSVSQMGTQSGSPSEATFYKYNSLGHLTDVSMDRAEGTQKRSFRYDSGGRLLMKHHAEGGPRKKQYNVDGTLASISDAKSQKLTYTWDHYKRPTELRAYDSSGALEDNTAYTYHYDQNPYDSEFSENVQGRVAAIRYGSLASSLGRITEMYSYTPSGHIASKRLRIERKSGTAQIDAHISYDEEGKLLSVSYPQSIASLTYAYNSMGKLSTIVSGERSIVKDVLYKSTGELDSLKIIAGRAGVYLSEKYEYDARNQLVRITAKPEKDADSQETLPHLDLEYCYRNDDGRVLSETDHVNGATVSYAYDHRGRLSKAESSDGAWGLKFEYDGFGNRVSQKVISGVGYDVTTSHDPSSNHIIAEGYEYDPNGNLTSLPSGELAYDSLNRLTATGGGESYAYDAQNLRIWKKSSNGVEDLSFYLGDRKIATFEIRLNEIGHLVLKPATTNIFMGSRLIQSNEEILLCDRLGAVRAWSGKNKAGSTKYFPFGEEVRSTGESPARFGGYERDLASGLDYAEQRYYSSQLGRFVTPDPYDGSAYRSAPDSWNRYSFVEGDPINLVDPNGLCAPPSSGSGWHSTTVTNPDGSTTTTSDYVSNGDTTMEVVQSYDASGHETEVEIYNDAGDQIFDGSQADFVAELATDILALQTAINNDTLGGTIEVTVAAASAYFGLAGGVAGGAVGSTEYAVSLDSAQNMLANDQAWSTWAGNTATR